MLLGGPGPFSELQTLGWLLAQASSLPRLWTESARGFAISPPQGRGKKSFWPGVSLSRSSSICATVCVQEMRTGLLAMASGECRWCVGGAGSGAETEEVPARRWGTGSVGTHMSSTMPRWVGVAHN